jgi:8-oxo-dGTP pyrophosphatase MutT (NUDIX family)
VPEASASRSAHAEATATLLAWVPPSPAQATLRDRFVRHLDRHPDGLDRSCRPDHLTASTLVLSQDGSRALLTLHAKAGRWFQLGGHLDPTDPALAAGALREALEESGLTGLALDPVPVQLDAHEVPFCGGPGCHHLDVRFLAVAPDGDEHVLSAESRDLRWWPVDALPTDEPSLRELVRLGLERLDGRRPVPGA